MRGLVCVATHVPNSRQTRLGYGRSSDWKETSLAEAGLPYLDKGKGDQSGPQDGVECCSHRRQRLVLNGLTTELIQRDHGCVCVCVCACKYMCDRYRGIHVSCTTVKRAEQGKQ